MSGIIRLGTSGFSYREWLGSFYPTRLPGNEMLSFYAERMPTVEVNYSFRAMPKPAMLLGWAARTPEHFRFALKAPERITHRARLANCGETVEHFVEVAQTLGHRLGPILFQLPPDFKCDLERLEHFLGLLNGRVRAAFEFRHRSWLTDTTFASLKTAGAALCIAESDKIETPIEKTADFAYLRLRKPAYDGDALRQWAARIIELASDGSEVYVYFKHEIAAPELAARLAGLVADSK